MWLFIPVNRPNLLDFIYTEDDAKQMLEEYQQRNEVVDYEWIDDGLRIFVNFSFAEEIV